MKLSKTIRYLSSDIVHSVGHNLDYHQLYDMISAISRIYLGPQEWEEDRISDVINDISSEIAKRPTQANNIFFVRITIFNSIAKFFI